MSAMHTESEYPGFLLKQAGRSISLVHIEVNNQDLVREPFFKQVISGHGKIIQQTKPLSPVGKCMVRAACHIQRHSVYHSMVTAIDSTLGNYKLPQGKLGRLRKTDMPLFAGR